MLHNFSQTERINIAEVKYLYFVADLAEFQSFNAVKFTNQFLSEFRKAINEVIAFKEDELVVDEGQELTQNVGGLMEEARKLYKNIKYFIEEAYPNNEPRKGRFGLDNYDDARKSPINMVGFLTQLYGQTTEFQQDLVDAGLDASKIADVLVLRNKLQQANAVQKAFSGERQEITQIRNQKLDLMDSFSQAVCKAGKLIYEDNPAKYRQYTIYQTSSATAASSHNISASSTEVADNSNTMPITQNTAFRIENQGNTPLQFYVNESLSDAMPATAITINANSSIDITAGEILGTGYQVLIARNDNPQVGKYNVSRLQEIVV